jgi:5,10-methylene-tetrahydrofolate dehydrogenase/methenyl tetrahydrofolate cyclohydrolase
MAAKIIDGKQIAADIRAELKAEVGKLAAKGITPGLGVILVGADPASVSYVTAKEKACGEIGIYSDDNRLPAEAWSILLHPYHRPIAFCLAGEAQKRCLRRRVL